MPFSTAEQFDEAFATVKTTFGQGITKDKKWRVQQLQRMWWMVEDNKDAILEAYRQDLNKHAQEAIIEVHVLQNDILHTLKNLDKWTADERPARMHPINMLGGTVVRKVPLGVTLIVGAWNFPLPLLLQPAVAAIAAGCAMILKPSDMSPANEAIVAKLVPQYLDSSAIRVITAGPQEMGHILERRFDHIFFTGGPNIAKIVHAAAAKQLTPVTLELGGQGPAIVCKSANIELVAKRIAATKFMNAGQICLCVNHIIVDPSVKDELISRLIHYFNIFLGDEKNQPDYYGRLVNDRNFSRLDCLLQKSSGQILYGGHRDRATKFFGPTIVDVQPNDALLSEELFGPILPIITADFPTALAQTNARDHPLALYAFTYDAAEREAIVQSTQSGGVTFNDCLMHAAAQDAPFGGVGTSGMGYYHGPAGILEFSHLRTFHDGPPAWLESVLSARYPPYVAEKVGKLTPRDKAPFDREGRKLGGGGLAKWVSLFAVAAVVVFWQRERLGDVVSELKK